jgi:hypothetical protein
VRRYQQSEKGKAAKKRVVITEASREALRVRRKAWLKTEKGKAYLRRQVECAKLRRHEKKRAS